MIDKMSDDDGDLPTLSSPSDPDFLAGLLGGMFDGMVVDFEYRNLHFVRSGNSMAAVHGTTGKQLGGRLHLKSASLKGAMEWAEAKADYYNEVHR